MISRWVFILTAILTVLSAACAEDNYMSRGVYNFNDDNLGADGVEPPQRSWSVYGNLTQLDTQKTVSIQANFDQPGMYTVQFDFSIVDADALNSNNSRPIICEATIYWNVAGNEVIRKMSVGPGASISGIAEGVRVVVKDATADPSGFVKISYNVAIQIAQGQRASVMPVLLEGPSGFLGAGATFQTDIPFPAGVKGAIIGIQKFDGSIIPDQGVIVKFQSNGLNYGRFACDPRQFDILPIPNGASRMALINNMTGPINYYCQWVIDG